MKKHIYIYIYTHIIYTHMAVYIHIYIYIHTNEYIESDQAVAQSKQQRFEVIKSSVFAGSRDAVLIIIIIIMI